jgi:hypothetical protein
VQGASLTAPTDMAVARAFGATRGKHASPVYGAPTGAPDPSAVGGVWRRVTFEGSRQRLLARTAVAIGVAARQFTETALRVNVPVDLRRHVGDVRTTANLTGIVPLDLAAVLDAADPVARAHSLLAERAAGAEAVQTVAAADATRGVPLWLMTRFVRAATRRSLRSDRHPGSAVISNLGLQDLAALSGPGVEARRAFWIPPGGPSLPLFLTLSGGPAGVEICGAMPQALAGAGAERLDALLAGIVAQLTESAPS